MSITCDYHMHSHHSGDSNMEMPKMMDYLIGKGITHMCFTEHYDPDYVYDQPDSVDGMFELNIDDYYKEYCEIKALYSDRINVGFGVELGIQEHLSDMLGNYAKSYDFDFIIASNHLCHRKDPYYSYFIEGRSDKEAFREYFESILESVNAYNDYDVIGHIDYPVRYAPEKDKNYHYKDYAEIFDAIFKKLIENGHGLEINSKGLRCGLMGANPSDEVLKHYRECGGEIITIGSDAHNLDELAWGLDKVTAILKKAGFEYYTTFTNRKPEFHKI